MRYVKTIVNFEHPDFEFAAELIADVFYQIGLKGVVIEDPSLTPPGGDSLGSARPAPSDAAVIAYIPQDERVGNRWAFIKRRLTQLTSAHQIRWQLRSDVIDEQNWAESWKAFFHRHRIGARMVVQPSWETHSGSEPEDLLIEIDPGQAFGTGTHPTTTLCMIMLEKHLKGGRSVLDVGTGSGILMITAAGLGAEKVWGVDSDPLAIASAEQNLRRNAVEARRWRLIQTHLIDGVDETFDFVVANILSDTIIELTDTIDRVLKAGGCFIASGIIEDRQREVASRMTDRGLSIVETMVQEQWVCITSRRRI